jgi:hypothetical protein
MNATRPLACRLPDECCLKARDVGWERRGGGGGACETGTEKSVRMRERKQRGTLLPRPCATARTSRGQLQHHAADVLLRDGIQVGLQRLQQRLRVQGGEGSAGTTGVKCRWSAPPAWGWTSQAAQASQSGLPRRKAELHLNALHLFVFGLQNAPQF